MENHVTLIKNEFTIQLVHTAAFWFSGNVIGHINKDTLHSAGLVLRWVTVLGYIVWYW